MNAPLPVADAARLATATAAEIAAAVSSGTVTARAVIEAVLARIAAVDPAVNAFTDVTAERARARADRIDACRAAGEALGPLAGVPFAVKNLFDVTGLPTRAGSKINRDLPPADRDATLVAKLEAADAVLVGALNMGEYAYDFTGENVHDGPSRNPRDLSRMSGGSSGGSGAAVAAGLVPLALGSDTNGSIRVPSSLCGTFGLKPTYGRLSRGGSFPFVTALDHLGPLARSVADLGLSYDAMQGEDGRDPGQTPRPFEPVSGFLGAGTDGLRIAVAGGYFRTRGLPEAFAAVDLAASTLGVTETVDVPDAARARAAAYIITAAEGASLHAGRLAARPEDFDPAVRDRLLAGLAIPASWVDAAQRFRRHFRDEMLKLFQRCDVLIAPATPCRAPKLGQKTFVLDGEEMLVRPNLGLFTQPISFIGLPVAAVPLWVDVGEARELPIAVQVIAPPWREDLALRVAAVLERTGAARAPVAGV
ncbi:AtzE family amidohydrolase [Xanthobacter dioxanivorans]|uniref:AtzE family amidohydrolase n=1 Tax=Xanthobacter dioxanivorans TaxID=2528964 RepID=A0A974SH65_9HYPH|nr:AtzE family amidohydrolase [Xanthobacter dioxanivorans]QRG05062.1 AtzE family amidohydrolase [Xanthobacter dioxanivorans]